MKFKAKMVKIIPGDKNGDKGLNSMAGIKMENGIAQGEKPFSTFMVNIQGLMNLRKRIN